MRIGLVLEQFDPARGGREQWTWSFTQRLLELGHEVHVVARSCSSKARRLPIAYHPIQCDPSPMAFAGEVRAVLEPLALDIVHDMGMGWYCDVFHPHGGSMASSAERKLLFLPAWLRGLKRMANRMLPRHRTFQALMQRQYADHGQIVLALSRASAADFQHFHGVAPERIRIVYNGVDTERFSPRHCRPHREAARRRLGLSADTVMALIVAHNFRLKGVATLLGAMRRLRTAGGAADVRSGDRRRQTRRILAALRRPPWPERTSRLCRAGRRSAAVLRRRRLLRPSHLLRSVQPRRAGGGRLCVALIDIDRLAETNEQFGYRVGNEILKGIAKLLEANRSDNVRAARFSGPTVPRDVLGYRDCRRHRNGRNAAGRRSTTRIRAQGFRHLRHAQFRAHAEPRTTIVLPRCSLRVEATLARPRRYGHNRTFRHEGKYPTPVVPPEFQIEGAAHSGLGLARRAASAGRTFESAFGKQGDLEVHPASPHAARHPSRPYPFLAKSSM